MSRTPLQQALLADLGIDHGFGVRGAATPPGLLRPKQVHGTAVVAAADCAASPAPEADAVWAAAPGVAVGVITADCVPILAVADDGRAVAAIHAGWRGLAQGVIEAGVAALRQVGARHVKAAIGPHIGSCCYEVDAPVLGALSTSYAAVLDAALRPTRSGHARLDLGRLARHALECAGVERDAVAAMAGVCTACDAQRFHSYRRDGPRAGRLVHFVRARKA